jgi:hypothetical protein
VNEPVREHSPLAPTRTREAPVKPVVAYVTVGGVIHLFRDQGAAWAFVESHEHFCTYGWVARMEDHP